MLVYQKVLYIRCVRNAWNVLEKNHLFTYVEKLRVSGSIRTKNSIHNKKAQICKFNAV